MWEGGLNWGDICLTTEGKLNIKVVKYEEELIVEVRCKREWGIVVSTEGTKLDGVEGENEEAAVGVDKLEDTFRS